MNVYLPGTGFATQGPCADGYHVPLKDEWEGVLNMMTGLGFTSLSDYVSKLHLPNASFRGSSDGNVSALTYGMYWTCNTGTSDGYGYCLQMRESYDTRILGSSVKTTGNSIRPFYNSYVEPDNTWTVIHGTLGSAGIFWNTTDGLISITNGTTGYTIADKNCGATTVFNSGDTKSESNCGKFYQRGNNYGFPFTGSVTTSSTKVDANSYGPGNYYSSSTFILYSSSNPDWSSVTNNNLRGGVDGNVQVMSELKNAYIGEVYEYSYDFRNKSTTNLTNDGWTVTGSPTFNSNGMSGNGPSVSRSLPTRNTANKITLTHTFDVRSGGSSMFRIGTMSNVSLTNVSGSYTLQGSYRRITIANSATNYNGVDNGTYTLVMTLDLVNGTWEVTTTGLSTQTGTITSTQKATILANMNNILADTYSSNGGYLQSLSITIE